MTDTLTPQDADDALAAEYVLGVQDLSDRAATETRIKRDPAFADLVTAWENRFAGLNDGFEEARAPNLLPRIEARLFPAAKSARPARLPMMRWLSGAAFAAALVLVGVATLVPPRPDLVAVLATADNRLSYEVASYGDRLQITRVAGVPRGCGPGARAVGDRPRRGPGLSGPSGRGAVGRDLPDPVSVGWVLAVSVEPAGGSPNGQPTGPVILTAQVGANI
jgi:anti-sigma-K factor RskA